MYSISIKKVTNSIVPLNEKQEKAIYFEFEKIKINILEFMKLSIVDMIGVMRYVVRYKRIIQFISSTDFNFIVDNIENYNK